jgi:hypothetical protein
MYLGKKLLIVLSLVVLLCGQAEAKFDFLNEWEGDAGTEWTNLGNWGGNLFDGDFLIDKNSYLGSDDPIVGTSILPNTIENLELRNGAILTVDAGVSSMSVVDLLVIRSGSSVVVESGTLNVARIAMTDENSSIVVDGGSLVVTGDIGLANDATQGTGTAGAQSLVLSSGSISCNNLVFDNTTSDSPSVTISGGTLSTTNDVYGNGGKVNLTLTGTGVLDVGGDLLLDDTGDVFNMSGGSWSLSSTPDFSSASLTMNGSSTQSVSCPGAIAVRDLTIDNASGAGLNVGVTVNNSLNLINGVFDVSAGGLTIEDNAVVTGYSSSNYVLGSVTKVGDDAFEFPLAKAIAMSTPSSATDQFTASYTAALPPYDVESIVGMERVSGLEYWNLDRPVGTSSVAITLSWDAGSDVGELADLQVAHWDGAQWISEGNSGTTGDESAGTVTSGLVSTFSPFTFGSSSTENPLPVEITSFKGRLSEGDVVLTWETATEINNSHFEIQRSVDGEKVEAIAKMPSKAEGGNSTQKISYSFTDSEPYYGGNYYRLKQVDVDGTIEFHKFIFINNDFQEIVEPTVYPNPTSNNEFTVEINETHQGARISLVSISGSTIPVDVEQSGKTYKISSAVPLKPGFYVLKIETLNGAKTHLTTKKVLVK